MVKALIKRILSTSLCATHQLLFACGVFNTSTHFLYFIKASAHGVDQSCASGRGYCSLSSVKSWGLLCRTEAASSQKYKRIFLGALSRALSTSLFINPQLFLSSLRKKTQSPCILVWKYPALTIVMFNFNSPALSVCCLPPHTTSVSCCVGFSERTQSDQSVFIVLSLFSLFRVYLVRLTSLNVLSVLRVSLMEL